MKKKAWQRAAVAILSLALLAGTFSGCQKAKTEESGEKIIIGSSYSQNSRLDDMTISYALKNVDVIFFGTVKGQSYQMTENGSPYFFTQFTVKQFYKGRDGPEIEGKALTLTGFSGDMPMKVIDESVKGVYRTMFPFQSVSPEQMKTGYFRYISEDATTLEIGKSYLVFAGYMEDAFGNMRLVGTLNPYGMIEFGTDGYPVWQEQVKDRARFQKTKDELIAEIKAAVKEQAEK